MPPSVSPTRRLSRRRSRRVETTVDSRGKAPHNAPVTPRLVLDEAVLADNIARMARRTTQAGLALRPHVKTHKCLEIADLQRAAGAEGITVATVSEAEIFAEAGHDDVFIAYPLWLDAERAARLRRLSAQVRILIGCDSIEAGRQIAASRARVEVLLEVDSGHRRSGVAPEHSGQLAFRLHELGLNVVGVFTFPGHSYARDRRRAAAQQEQAALAAAAASLREHGIEPQVISGGSSPSAAYVGSGLTEFRPGAYVFNDAQQWELGACSREQIALWAEATVVSHAGGRLILDSGSKVLGADRAAYATGFGRLLDYPEARIVQLSEHHAVAELAGPLPQLGEQVRVVPNHCCNAVNLADVLHLTMGATWPVAARNCND